jgi:large conductance mechanosensitive channel
MDGNEPKKTGKVKGIIEEFKTFIAKGNVVDMAVGLIVGSAFTAIVTSLVEDIFTPIIGMILAGINFNTLGIEIPWGNHPFIAVGNFIQAIITFFITAACVFAIVKLMNVFRKKEEPEPEKEPEPTKEELLLTEIRDLLKEQKKD